MRIARTLQELRTLLPDTAVRSVVSVGNFDGVHLGHQSVLRVVVERAAGLAAQSVVVTFDPHPSAVLRPEACPPLIMPLEQRLRLLAEAGIDATAVIPFTHEFSRWSSHDFARHVLADALHAVEVHEGENFRFGYGAAAGTEGLIELGREFGFAARSYQPLALRGGPVSSSRIRTLVQAGDLSTARALLGRPMSLFSTPASGRGFGTRYAVPTINLATFRGLHPGDGVYVTGLRIGAGAEARTFFGVSNAGNRPTFGEDSYAIESHLFDFEPVELRPETPLELSLLHRLRDERRFASTEALLTQIGRDVSAAKRFLGLACRNRAAVPQP